MGMHSSETTKAIENINQLPCGWSQPACIHLQRHAMKLIAVVTWTSMLHVATLISSRPCSRSISSPMFKTQWSRSARLRVLNTMERPGTPRRDTYRSRCLGLPSSSRFVRKSDFLRPCHRTKQVIVSSSVDVQPSSR